MMYACSNFDPSLAFKLAPVCQEAREAEHACLLLVGQAQHRSSKAYMWQQSLIISCLDKFL